MICAFIFIVVLWLWCKLLSHSLLNRYRLYRKLFITLYIFGSSFWLTFGNFSGSFSGSSFCLFLLRLFLLSYFILLWLILLDAFLSCARSFVICGSFFLRNNFRSLFLNFFFLYWCINNLFFRRLSVLWPIYHIEMTFNLRWFVK